MAVRSSDLASCYIIRSVYFINNYWSQGSSISMVTTRDAGLSGVSSLQG